MRDLESALADLESLVEDPVAGLFGPRSEVWDKNGASIVFAGAGRAALLQLAHPAVAQAVDEFSITRADRLGRFRKTFQFVFAMVFGDLPTAFEMARTVHRIHERVRGVIRDDDAGPLFERGAPYQANDPAAQLWVASTLFDSSAWVFENLVRPLTEEEKARWVSEFPRFTGLFAIPEEIVPKSWPEFVDYNRSMWASPLLTVSATARSLKDVLVEPPSLAMTPFWRWYTLFTAGALPPRIREQFGFAWGRRQRLAFSASVRALRRVNRALPRRLQHLPSYQRALARIAGEPERRIDQLLDRWLFAV